MVAYRQTYEIIRGIQEKAAEQCAPVIFGIKPSNLLIIDQCYAKALKSLVETTGLKVRCFEHRAEKQVWFMFREEPPLQTTGGSRQHVFYETIWVY